jgi:hypothetical protein
MLAFMTQTLAVNSQETARITELVGGYQLSQIIACMARLDIATHVAEGESSVAELAQLTGAKPESLFRFLRAAAGLGLLEQVGRDRFTLTPLGKWLQGSNHGPSMREFAIGLSSTALTRTFEHLTEAVITDQPVVERALGSSLYEYLAMHPDEASHFARAMGEMSDGSARQIVAQYDVSVIHAHCGCGRNLWGRVASLAGGGPTRYGGAVRSARGHRTGATGLCWNRGCRKNRTGRR